MKSNVVELYELKAEAPQILKYRMIFEKSFHTIFTMGSQSDNKMKVIGADNSITRCH